MTSNEKTPWRAASMAALVCSVAAGSSPAAADSAAVHETPAQLVGALHSAFGEHHARAVHAKGVMFEGTFTPAPSARSLTKAKLFDGASLPITVRFSDFTGIPDIPDTADGANPRGFAVKFRLPDGTQTDVVTHSFNGFPTANADEFAQLLRAIGASGEGAAKPTALDSFLAAHPIAKTFLTTQKPAPVSYATLAYFGVNSFAFTDAAGKRRFVRYRFVPVAGEKFLDAATLKAQGPNYLIDEIGARIAKQPVRYDWYAQLAESGDVVADPSIAWPESRKLVKLGSLEISRPVADPVAADKSTLFQPGNLLPGMEAADPMIDLRHAAYPISFGARQ